MFRDVIMISDVNLNDGVPYHDIMRQTACLVVNPIIVDGYATWHPIQPVYIKHVKILDFLSFPRDG